MRDRCDMRPKKAENLTEKFDRLAGLLTGKYPDRLNSALGRIHENLKKIEERKPDGMALELCDELSHELDSKISELESERARAARPVKEGDSVPFSLFPGEKQPEKKKTGGMKKKKLQDYLFFFTIAALPFLVLLFYQIFINANSIALAFKEYFLDAKGNISVRWAGLKNFGNVVHAFDSGSEFYKNDIFGGGAMPAALLHSLKVYGFTLVVTTIVPILFTYYMYKRSWGHNVFKVILFLPSVISSVVLVLIFRYIVERLVPDAMMKLFDKKVPDLLQEPTTQFGTVLFYKVWMMFGGGMLVQLAAMNSVDKSVVEAGKLDGLSYLGELWHVVLPHSYTVISLGFITGIVSIFVDDFGLYAFYGENAGMDVSTLGYFFLIQTKRAQDPTSRTHIYLPFLAAWGLFASMIAIPLTFFARWAIYKFGPQEE